jgi:hypothetical protein
MKRGFKSHRDAEEAQTLRMARFLTGENVVTPEKTTLIEYVQKWFGNQKLARTTRSGYKNIIEKHIAKDPIGSMLVSQIQCSTGRKHAQTAPGNPAPGPGQGGI